MFHSSASEQKRCTLEQGPIANSDGEEERNSEEEEEEEEKKKGTGLMSMLLPLMWKLFLPRSFLQFCLRPPLDSGIAFLTSLPTMLKGTWFQGPVTTPQSFGRSTSAAWLRQ